MLKYGGGFLRGSRGGGGSGRGGGRGLSLGINGRLCPLHGGHALADEGTQVLGRDELGRLAQELPTQEPQDEADTLA